MWCISSVQMKKSYTTGVEGVVIIDVTVDQGGVPVDCLFMASRSHRVFEESALAAVMKARFRPGTENGGPVRDTFRLKVRFELDTRGS
jgi:TonB family protein